MQLATFLLNLGGLGVVYTEIFIRYYGGASAAMVSVSTTSRVVCCICDEVDRIGVSCHSLALERERERILSTYSSYVLSLEYDIYLHRYTFKMEIQYVQ